MSFQKLAFPLCARTACNLTNYTYTRSSMHGRALTLSTQPAATRPSHSRRDGALTCATGGGDPQRPPPTLRAGMRRATCTAAAGKGSGRATRGAAARKSSACAKVATRSVQVTRLSGRGRAWRGPAHACRGAARATPCCSGSSRLQRPIRLLIDHLQKKMVGAVERRELEGVGWLRRKPNRFRSR